MLNSITLASGNTSQCLDAWPSNSNITDVVSCIISIESGDGDTKFGQDSGASATNKMTGAIQRD
ncbi:hypothetical protein BFJ63_vAg14505 [Fusarium oxysporum f. sp. narcissi]|uniref:Uncharacterized protein n=1 Tax=Fusarium oxysporum f. sp. narcissi TaxID=451672 RepID=A0A4Q2VF47_FUSOX|nr:hypothetical protein BFJ70_g10701 [Fusarium oxysporum]RYC82627.1 hypothetical protein BFJ63_vAg14505 [Fusarium oxysporum f. sp. narcissi]